MKIKLEKVYFVEVEFFESGKMRLQSRKIEKVETDKSGRGKLDFQEIDFVELYFHFDPENSRQIRKN